MSQPTPLFRLCASHHPFFIHTAGHSPKHIRLISSPDLQATTTPSIAQTSQRAGSAPAHFAHAHSPVLACFVNHCIHPGQEYAGSGSRRGRGSSTVLWRIAPPRRARVSNFGLPRSGVPLCIPCSTPALLRAARMPCGCSTALPAGALGRRASAAVAQRQVHGRLADEHGQGRAALPAARAAGPFPRPRPSCWQLVAHFNLPQKRTAAS